MWSISQIGFEHTTYHTQNSHSTTEPPGIDTFTCTCIKWWYYAKLQTNYCNYSVINIKYTQGIAYNYLYIFFIHKCKFFWQFFVVTVSVHYPVTKSLLLLPKGFLFSSLLFDTDTSTHQFFGFLKHIRKAHVTKIYFFSKSNKYTTSKTRTTDNAKRHTLKGSGAMHNSVYNTMQCTYIMFVFSAVADVFGIIKI